MPTVVGMKLPGDLVMASLLDALVFHHLIIDQTT